MVQMPTRIPCLLFLLGPVVLAGCSGRESKVQIEKTRPLPEVAASDQNFSSYKEAHPFTEMAPTLLSRTIFQGGGPNGYRIEIRELRLDGQKTAENLTLPGATFAQVRYGSGVITLGDQRQELALGTTIPISQGQRFSLQSNSAQPLVLRVHLVSAE
jgi:hypothetical protein